MLHTLQALADGDKHGYAILKEAARRTDGTVRLGAGTLYALVKRAVAGGLPHRTAAWPLVSRSRRDARSASTRSSACARNSAIYRRAR
jgi:hypothetical protein